MVLAPILIAAYTAAATHAAPPVPTRVATALASRLGSGESAIASGGTACGPLPAAQGLGLMAVSPAVRKEVVAAAQVGVRWPVSSKPSEQIAFDEPLFEPAAQVPGAVQVWPSVYTP